MRRTFPILAALLTVATLGAACARSTELDLSAPTDQQQVQTAPKKNAPEWVVAGFALAAGERAAEQPLTRPTIPAPTTTVAQSSLPPKDQFVATLAQVGIEASSASCIYDSIAGGPVEKDVSTILSLVGQATGGGGGDVLAGASALDAVQGIDQGTIQRFAVAVAPCLDTATLLTLVAGGALGGSGSGSGGGLSSSGSIAALVGGLGATAASGGDASQLARVAGTNLSPAQLSAVLAMISAGAAGEVAKVDPRNLDLEGLDLKKLDAGQVTLLIAAIVRGLSPKQKTQLDNLAKVDLAKLDLQIDTSKLSGEQAGALLLVFLPFLSAGISPITSGPPVGGDPGSIYIPPGADLSNINPLYFVPRENLVTGLLGEGVDSQVGGCLYDRLRLIDPRLLGVAFSGRDNTATGQILLSITSCLVAV